eukprot:TRINITY_DN3580_c0_g3_i1.p1 TRINITY_DN3580_c0_g3~~TRINITY_DN3580_c0_g3_i1.p1  ORF type:complete len:872 (+),score=106.15 TRINITY_DN3580_c0_g3_i1:56-2671(+)
MPAGFLAVMAEWAEQLAESPSEQDSRPWSEKSLKQKISYALLHLFRGVVVLGVLYMFTICLGLMGLAFQVIGGPSAGASLRAQAVLGNPIAGLVLGILSTVLLQSSSLSTSIVISMTAAGHLDVGNAIPMIMGANIGTSVTNTIVALGMIKNRDEYRKAFAGATVHDCFNLLTVCILLPVEASTYLLRSASAALLLALHERGDRPQADWVNSLKVITRPALGFIVRVDREAVTRFITEGDTAASMILNDQSTQVHLFMDTPMDEISAGWLLLVVSLILLCTCLVMLVLTLQSVFRHGPVAKCLKGLLNLQFRSCPCIADFILVAVGASITVIVQSSSITTSAMTPMVGIGAIKLEKMFAFTLGANIGTCITGVLSAMAGANIAIGMQVAITHLLLNMIGFLIWFPVPYLRRVPVSIARFLGDVAAEWNCFPLVYISVVFGLLPTLLFLLSLAGEVALAIGGTIMLLGSCFLAFLIVLRRTEPLSLPRVLQSDPWWLPSALRTDEAARAAAADAYACSVARGEAVGQRKSWLAPMAWGPGWFVLCLLCTSVPNNQWAMIRYEEFDGREHVGIGAWSTCSSNFKKPVWYSAPMQDCPSQNLTTCFTELSAACALHSFSSQPGANRVYETSWQRCRDACTIDRWQDECTSMACSSSNHVEQCNNVSSSVMYPANVTYGTGRAWPSGSACRSNHELYDSELAAILSHAGTAGIIATASAFFGQISLLLGFNGKKKRSTKQILLASLFSFALCWTFILISLLLFNAVVLSSSTWTLMDARNSGAVRVEGRLEDVAARSLSHSLLIVSWCLVMPIIVVIGIQLNMTEHSAPESNEPEVASGNVQSIHEIIIEEEADMMEQQEEVDVTEGQVDDDGLM